MPTQILMPTLSPTMEAGTLAKWLVVEGDRIEAGDLIAEIETDKAIMEFEAVDDGTLGKILVPEGSTGIRVNSPIALLLNDGEGLPDDLEEFASPRSQIADLTQTADVQVSHLDTQSAQRQKGVASERIFASPLARRIAQEAGVDLGKVSGSGPGGRVIKRDVEQESARPVTGHAVSPTSATRELLKGMDSSAVAAIYKGREYDEVKLDGMRKTIAARLTEAKQTIPHFYLRREIHLDKLLSLRSEVNKSLEPKGIKLSINDFIIKASALALQSVPSANAVWSGDRIFLLKPSDVAVAVAVEGGLFTPVIKDAHEKSVTELSSEMKDLANRARSRSLKPQEYLGGSFAISNLGMYGIENFDAVINPPHGSILAVGAGLRKPVSGQDGQVEFATLMSVTLSIDHRVIDGVLGAQFLAEITKNLESPLLMLI